MCVPDANVIVVSRVGHGGLPKRCTDVVRAERGHTLSYETVKRFVRPLRQLKVAESEKTADALRDASGSAEPGRLVEQKRGVAS